MEDVVSQVSDEVVVVPLDSNGEIPPLVEAATASAFVSGDPIFCPGYAEWGDPTCTGPLPTIEDALNTASAEGSGTIYVAIDYTDFRTEPFDNLNGSDSSNQFPVLNLIGGVDLSTGKVIGKTTLNRPVDVSGFWVIQIENFIISGVEGTALSVNSTDYARVYNSDLSENTESGLSVAANENAIIADVKAEK